MARTPGDHTRRDLYPRRNNGLPVGGRIPSILATVRDAPAILMIDGCPLECGANVLRHAGFTNFRHLKLHELNVLRYDSGAVSEATVTRLAEAALRVLNMSPGNPPP